MGWTGSENEEGLAYFPRFVGDPPGILRGFPQEAKTAHSCSSIFLETVGQTTPGRAGNKSVPTRRRQPAAPTQHCTLLDAICSCGYSKPRSEVCFQLATSYTPRLRSLHATAARSSSLMNSFFSVNLTHTRIAALGDKSRAERSSQTSRATPAAHPHSLRRRACWRLTR